MSERNDTGILFVVIISLKSGNLDITKLTKDLIFLYQEIPRHRIFFTIWKIYVRLTQKNRNKRKAHYLSLFFNFIWQLREKFGIHRISRIVKINEWKTLGTMIPDGTFKILSRVDDGSHDPSVLRESRERAKEIEADPAWLGRPFGSFELCSPFISPSVSPVWPARSVSP